MQQDKGKRIAKKVERKYNKVVRGAIKSGITEMSKGRDYPLSATPKMQISPLDGKVYIDKAPVSAIKKNK